MTLDELRRGLNELDRQLLTLMAERQRVSREVARVKRETGYPTRDYQRERTVIMGARNAAAAELGVSPDLAENLMRMLIRSSLATQEQISVATQGHRLRPSRAGHRRQRQDGPLVRRFHGLPGLPGGCLGYGRGAAGIHGRRATGSSADLAVYDYIVVATPLGATGPSCESWRCCGRPASSLMSAR